MVKYTKTKFVPTLLAVLLISSALFGATFFYESKQVSSANITCPSGFNIWVDGSSGSTSELQGLANVIVSESTASTLTISRVFIKDGSQRIGQAVKGPGTWTMKWLTSLSPNGAHEIGADIVFSDGNICQAPIFMTYTNNPTVATLAVTVNPSSWQGPINTSQWIYAHTKSSSTTIDLTPFTIYTWDYTIGALPSKTPIGDGVKFFSGPNDGSGRIRVIAEYAGRKLVAEVPVTVKAADAPISTTNTSTVVTTTSSTTSDDTTITQTDDDAADDTTQQQTETVTVVRPTSIQDNPTVQACVTNVVGQDKYELINVSKVRPTYEELLKYRTCFASTNYVLPSNFAPVEPNTIRELNITQKVRLNKIENITKQTEEGETVALQLSGTAEPNSVVIIYVFSEPLVLTTDVDPNGNWVYVLEDPIEPGDHEVYTIVDRGNGEYERSDPVSFVIGTASAAASSPGGLSLELAQTPGTSQRSTLLYIAGAIGLIVIVLVALWVILGRSKKAHLLKGLAPAEGILANGVASSNTPPSESNAVTIGSAEDNTETDGTSSSASVQTVTTIIPTTNSSAVDAPTEMSLANDYAHSVETPITTQPSTNENVTDAVIHNDTPIPLNDTNSQSQDTNDDSATPANGIGDTQLNSTPDDMQTATPSIDDNKPSATI